MTSSVQFHLVESCDQLLAVQSLEGLTPLDQQTFLRQVPDQHWLMRQDRRILAYCSLWWRNTPTSQSQTLGYIGHYAAAQPALPLIDHACRQLANQGCTLAIAPIDGSTWQRYRFTVERGTEPAFFLEPDYPDAYLDHFLEAGFTTFAEYSSALNSNLSQTDPRLGAVASRLAGRGVKIRSLHLQNFTTELSRIYALCLISFQNNLLYSPIALADFMVQYRQIEPYLRPELVLLAEQADQLVGFGFAVPDLLQAPPIDTIILKTVAVLPGRDYAGLGNLLVSQVQQRAQQLGYRRAIHALMHDSNNSRNLSRRYAQPMRRYVLLSKSLK